MVATIGEFAKQWHIVKWTLGTLPGRIPSHGFKNNGTISLTRVDGTPACDVSWKDANERPCSIEVLPFDEADGTLHASDITVQFSAPTGGGNPLRLEVTLRIENDHLIGTFGPVGPKGGQDANTGTFIADANPPGPGEEKRRKPRAEALALT